MVAKNTTTETKINTDFRNSFFYPVEKKDKNPYELDIKLHSLSKGEYQLEIDVKLMPGSFFVSPNSKGDFKGKFRMDFKDKSNINLITDLKETPLTIEVFDDHPYVNGKVNWVKENTVYKQKLKVKSKENFITTGVIRFVIEPRCTLEEIPFLLVYEHGKLVVRRDMC